MVAVVATAMSGCTPPWQESPQEGADRAAATFASAVQAGTATIGDPDGTQSAPLKDILAGMGSVRPEVSVSGVALAEDDRSATAKLRYTWRFTGQATPWTYDTEAAVQRGDSDWQVASLPDDVAPGLRSGEHLSATRIPAGRGDILGAGDAPLVTAREVVRIGIDRGAVPAAKAAASARLVAAAAGVDAAAYAKQVSAAGEKAFVEAIVLRPDAATPVWSKIRAVPGAVAVRGTLPLAPTATFARAILGTVGEATAEIVEKSQGKVRVGDVVGLSGLQAAHQNTLAGTPGYSVRAAQGSSTRELVRVAPQVGKPLRTSLDADLQTLAEKTLTSVKPASALVAIRPSDGQVLAAASGPGSDGFATATLGQYAPGSTFKVVTLLALLRSGLTLDSTVPCTPTLVVDGRTFKNYDDYPAAHLGVIPLRTAFANSCNTALMSQGDRVSPRALADAAAAFGYGEPALGIPAFLGRVPAETTPTGRAASLIGQSQVLASPLGMATIAASVARGQAVQPRLVLDAEAKPTKPSRPLTPAEAAGLREAMQLVTTEGSGAVLRGLPGPVALSKTGTAEYGSATPPATHAWMIGVHGDLAVAVFVADGAGGSRTAGPLLKAFLAGAPS